MRIGLYPGTFDPLTFGHMDIIRRATGLVDRLIVGVATNEDKQPMFTVDERVNIIKAQVMEASNGINGDVIIHKFDNLLIELNLVCESWRPYAKINIQAHGAKKIIAKIETKNGQQKIMHLLLQETYMLMKYKKN